MVSAARGETVYVLSRQAGGVVDVYSEPLDALGFLAGSIRWSLTPGQDRQDDLVIAYGVHMFHDNEKYVIVECEVL